MTIPNLAMVGAFFFVVWAAFTGARHCGESSAHASPIQADPITITADPSAAKPCRDAVIDISKVPVVRCDPGQRAQLASHQLLVCRCQEQKP